MQNQVNTRIIPKILGAMKKPSRYNVGFMADEEIARSIRFPKELWDAIDADATKHKRSSVKHMDFILSEYFFEERIELKHARMLKMKAEPGHYRTDPPIELDNVMFHDTRGTTKDEQREDVKKVLARAKRKK